MNTSQRANPNGYAQPLQAHHLTSLMFAEPGSEPILAFAHSSPPQSMLTKLLRKYAGQLVGAISPLPAGGSAWVTPALIRCRFPSREYIVSLAHVSRAVIRHGGVDIHLPGQTLHIPALCRPAPFANIINGIISARYDPTLPFRPACRTCSHRHGQGCGAQPPPITNTDCCPDTSAIDWCVAHRPAAS